MGAKIMKVAFEYVVPYGIAWGGSALLLYFIWKGLTCACC